MWLNQIKSNAYVLKTKGRIVWWLNLITDNLENLKGNVVHCLDICLGLRLNFFEHQTCLQYESKL